MKTKEEKWGKREEQTTQVGRLLAQEKMIQEETKAVHGYPRRIAAIVQNNPYCDEEVWIER